MTSDNIIQSETHIGVIHVALAWVKNQYLENKKETTENK